MNKLLTSDAEQRLIERVLQGHPEAFKMLMRQKGADLYYYDPFIKSFRYNDETITGVDAPDFGAYDCLVILTDHSCFDYEAIAKSANLIVDTRNAAKNIEDRGNIVTL